MTRKRPANPASSPNGSTKSRYASLTRSVGEDRAQFSECLGGLLAGAIDGVIDSGDLISFSRTSDGGAICIFIKSGAEEVRCYSVVQTELDEHVQKLADAG